jgi:hypothetical protein
MKRKCCKNALASANGCSEWIIAGSDKGCEFSAGVRKSESVALRHPIVPVADSFIGLIRPD